MIALEAWAFDVGQILAAYLDVVSLGAHSALQTLTGFTYMSFPLALSIAVSIRVGHLLGSGDYRQAQVAMRATVMLTTCFMVMIALTMLILRDFLSSSLRRFSLSHCVLRRRLRRMRRSNRAVALLDLPACRLCRLERFLGSSAHLQKLAFHCIGHFLRC